MVVECARTVEAVFFAEVNMIGGMGMSGDRVQVRSARQESEKSLAIVGSIAAILAAQRSMGCHKNKPIVVNVFEFFLKPPQLLLADASFVTAVAAHIARIVSPIELRFFVCQDLLARVKRRGMA